MKRTSSKPVPPESADYQVTSVRKAPGASGGVNSRLSSKRQSLNESSSPDPEPAVSISNKPPSSSRQPVSTTRPPSKARPSKNISNPFDDDDEEEDEEKGTMPKAYSSKATTAAIPSSSNKKNNPFDDDDEDEDEPEPAVSSVRTKKPLSQTAKKSNPFEDDDSPTVKTYGVPSKPNRFAFYDANETKAEPPSQTRAPATAASKSNISNKNPFMDDDEEDEDAISNKISSYQKSKVSSNGSVTVSSVKPKTNTKTTVSANPFLDEDNEEEEEEYPPAKTMNTNPTRTSLYSAYPTTSKSSNAYPPSKSQVTKPASNPFMDDSEAEEEEEYVEKPKINPGGKKVTINTAKTNPFHDDDDEDEEQGMAFANTKAQVNNSKAKVNPFDSEEEEEEVEEYYKPSKSETLKPITTNNNTKNAKKANPFDSEGDEEEEERLPSKQNKKTSKSPTTTAATDTLPANNYEDSEQEAEFVRKNSSKNCFLRLVFALCPRLAPLHPAMFTFLTLAVAIPAIGYVAAFTKIGYGNTVFFYLSRLFQHQAWLFAISLAGYCLLLYIFDVEYWTSRIGKWTRSMVFIILLLAIGTFLLFVSGETPYGPIALFTVLVPIWMIALRSIFFRRVPTRVYVSWLGLPMFFVSILIGAGWIYWTYLDDSYKWTLYIRLSDNEKMGCVPDFTNHYECKGKDNETGVVLDTPCFYVDNFDRTVIFPDGCKYTCVNDVYSSCTSTFIIWVGPLLVAVSLFFLSFFTSFLRPNNDTGDINKFATLWIFLLFAMWVAASLAGIAQGIVTTLAALTLASLVASMILLINSTTKDEREKRMNELMTTANEKFGNYVDILRGLLVIVAAPIIVLFLFLSCFVQFIRVINPFTCFCKPTRREKNRHDEDYKFKFMTTQADRQIRAFLKWDRVRVFKWAIYWGIAFISLNVLLSKFTVLFLAWLITELKKSSLEAVTFIMIGVGIALFLLPPVPGVPIYLSIGIIIPAVGGDTLTLVGSVAYATGICFVMRQIALAMQLKMGACMKHFVSVRKLCAVNTTIVRAATVVLKDKWPTMAKCCALIGLPEWPMATMCGVLDLPLLSIQLATIPVVLLILPTVMTGTFLYMSSILKSNGDPKYPSSTTLAAILAVATALVHFGSMVIAAYYVGQVMQTRKAEVDAIPIDEEVKASEEKDELNNQVYKEATKWSNVPWYMKIILILAVILMMGSCYLVQLYQSYCFADFTLTSTIEVDLQGDWTKIVKPLGALSILLFFLSCLLLITFSVWASMRVSKMKKGHIMVGEAPVKVISKKENVQKEVKRRKDRGAEKKDTTKVDVFEDNDVEEQREKSKPRANPFDDDEEEEVTPKAHNTNSAHVSKMNPFDDEEEEDMHESYPTKATAVSSNKKNPFGDDDDDDKPAAPSVRTSYPLRQTSNQMAKKRNPFGDDDEDDDEPAPPSIPPSYSSKSTGKKSNRFEEEEEDGYPSPSKLSAIPNKPNRYAFYDANESKPEPVSQTKAISKTAPVSKNNTTSNKNPFMDDDEEEDEVSNKISSYQKTNVSSNMNEAIPNSNARPKPNTNSTNPFLDEEEEEEEEPTYTGNVNQTRTSSYGYTKGRDQGRRENSYPLTSKSTSAYPPPKSQVSKSSSNPFMDDSEGEGDYNEPMNIGTTNPFNDDEDEEQGPPFSKSKVSNKAKSNPFDSEEEDEEQDIIRPKMAASKPSKSNPFDSEGEDEEEVRPSTTTKVSKAAEPEPTQKPQKKGRFSRRGKN